MKELYQNVLVRLDNYTEQLKEFVDLPYEVAKERIYDRRIAALEEALPMYSMLPEDDLVEFSLRLQKFSTQALTALAEVIEKENNKLVTSASGPSEGFHFLTEMYTENAAKLISWRMEKPTYLKELEESGLELKEFIKAKWKEVPVKDLSQELFNKASQYTRMGNDKDTVLLYMKELYDGNL